MKKYILAILILTLVVCVTACGGSEKSNNEIPTRPVKVGDMTIEAPSSYSITFQDDRFVSLRSPGAPTSHANWILSYNCYFWPSEKQDEVELIDAKETTIHNDNFGDFTVRYGKNETIIESTNYEAYAEASIFIDDKCYQFTIENSGYCTDSLEFDKNAYDQYFQGDLDYALKVLTTAIESAKLTE